MAEAIIIGVAIWGGVSLAVIAAWAFLVRSLMK